MYGCDVLWLVSVNPTTAFPTTTPTLVPTQRPTTVRTAIL